MTQHHLLLAEAEAFVAIWCPVHGSDWFGFGWVNLSAQRVG